MLREESRNFMVCLTSNVTVVTCIKKAAVLNFGRDKDNSGDSIVFLSLFRQMSRYYCI